jgi:hypothetical protein
MTEAASQTSTPADHPQPPSPSSSSRPLVGLLIALFVGYYLLHYGLYARRIKQGHFGDFQHFYFAARAMLAHQDLYSSGTGGYLYPPLIAFLYTPVARLSQAHAALVMLAVNCLISAGAIYLCAGEYLRRFGFNRTPLLLWSIVVLGLLFNADKVRGDLQMQQTNALMMLMFAIALCCLDRVPIVAGLALGFILNIKYLSLGMLPYLIVRRRWMALAGFVVGAILFGLLPAVIEGFPADLHDLRVSFGGLLHMVAGGSTPSSAEHANVEDITAMFSMSITSAMARMTWAGASMHLSLAYAALIALITLLVAVALYARERMPFLLWPSANQQAQGPWPALVALEWSGLIAAALIFSPQTNVRHLALVVFVTVPAAVLLLPARRQIGRQTWSALILATILMWLGFTMPQVSAHPRFTDPREQWFAIGGPCWCLLVLFLTVLSAGLVYVREMRRVRDGNRSG